MERNDGATLVYSTSQDFVSASESAANSPGAPSPSPPVKSTVVCTSASQPATCARQSAKSSMEP